MKKTLIIASLILTSASAHAQALQPTAMGLHLGSWHSQPGYNNANPGVFAQWDGWTAGIYRNSEFATSMYFGHTWESRSATPLDLRVALTAGLISGYRRASVLPLLVPTVSVGVASKTRLQLSYVPPIEKLGTHALHFSIKREF